MGVGKAALYSLVLLTGCLTSNESGNLAATSSGDTSHPAERGSPVAELRVYFEIQGDELVSHAIDGTGTEFDSVIVPRARG